jgi:hypothetical protein
LGLTTTPHSDWRKKIEEARIYNLKEVALFPTFLEIEKRKELYKLLDDSPIEEIPHVHLRDDMEEWEIELFEQKYNTKYYNIHERHVGTPVFEKYASKIYIENDFTPMSEERVKKYGGLCVDFSHLERTQKRSTEIYEYNLGLAGKYKIGCCHISAVEKKRYKLLRLLKRCGSHYLMNLAELDYVKKYFSYLPDYVSIELENSFEQQLEAKKYLEKIING